MDDPKVHEVLEVFLNTSEFHKVLEDSSWSHTKSFPNDMGT